MPLIPLFFAFLYIASCAPQVPYTVENILLIPKIKNIESTQKPIKLMIQDQRQTQVIGHKQFGLERPSPILLDDIGNKMISPFSEILYSKGYSPQHYHSTSPLPSLQIFIKEIQYIHNARLINGETDLVIIADVIATNSTQQAFKRHYEVRSHDEDLFKPSASHQAQLIDSNISKALTELLEKIIIDKDILHYLQ